MPLENRDVLRLVSWWTAGIRRQAIMQRQLPDGRWSQQFLVPADYIEQHCELAYGGNGDGAAGKTPDTPPPLVPPPTNPAPPPAGAPPGRERHTPPPVTP